MEAILQKLELYGYVILFFSSFGGSFLGIVSAGILSSLGKLDLFLSILIASCGNICGSMILAYISRCNKHFFRSSKWKRKTLIVSLWFRKYGVSVFLLSKYIYAIKSLVPIAIGLSSYPLWKFWLWNSFSSLFWGIIMGCIGFFASNAILQLLQDQWGYILGSIIVCAVFIGILLFKSKTRKKEIAK
ncbi:DedA family protein [Helicobacter cholecystus]|uniref:DedA family protein n=1 Tax=Helicobacter cholecystus TaxID=45498 RepID=A0A3D8IXI9_9HELI|nr:DedA family protein [Helicobacter cholecystus]RDU69635.1 DedA family protein [Helicobacter cholecystus]VEJ24195.1 integral membrane protein [Helicobacter cholecystus]